MEDFREELRDPITLQGLIKDKYNLTCARVLKEAGYSKGIISDCKRRGGKLRRSTIINLLKAINQLDKNPKAKVLTDNLYYRNTVCRNYARCLTKAARENVNLNCSECNEVEEI